MEVMEKPLETDSKVTMTEPVDTAPVKITRRTIDRVLVWSGLVVAVVLAAAGALLLWGSNFADDYVTDELTSQQIFFPSEEDLLAEDPPRDDLVQYADEQVTTGQEAEAYASFIDGHLQRIGGGLTYAQLGEPQSEARAALAEAQESGAPEEEITALQDEVTAITAQRDSMFKGETLRGLLLSSYAWATVGQVAGIAAIVAFVAAAAMLVMVVLGSVHLRRLHG